MMEEDWEDEHRILHFKELLKSNWDDEDADENDVKESWEDEDELATEPAPPSTEPIENAPDNKGKKVMIEKGEDVDHLAEILRQHRLVEEADKSDEKNLDNFIPKSESDFLEYAELISHKLRPFEKSYHYMNLLKTVMRLSMTSIKGSEVKEIASSITSIANEKIKAEKEANTDKKKTGANKSSYILTSLMTIWLLIYIVLWMIMISSEKF